MEVKLHIFSTLTPDGGMISFMYGRFTAGKEFQYPVDRRLNGKNFSLFDCRYKKLINKIHRSDICTYNTVNKEDLLGPETANKDVLHQREFQVGNTANQIHFAVLDAPVPVPTNVSSTLFLALCTINITSFEG
jgi:hypothetical protein